MTTAAPANATHDELYQVEGKAELIGGRIVRYMAFGFAPASSNFLISGRGSAVTIQGKFGAVSMFRRSTAQNSGVKP